MSGGTKTPIVFSGQNIRRHWDADKELWYFSVVDIVSVFSGSIDPRKYWNKLSQRLREEGSEVVTKCHQLKLMASDGKKYLTDVADTETIFRLIQSIPSPKAEPLKLWLAKVGYQRVEEIADPELAINRAISHWLRQGRSRAWINLRLKSIEIRKSLTDEWEDRGVNQPEEFAILTDDTTQAWAGITTKQYKEYKNLTKESLRDNMDNLELVFNMLAEASTTEISKKEMPDTFPKNRTVAKSGGKIAGDARIALEKQTGQKVIKSSNYLNQQKKLSKPPSN